MSLISSTLRREANESLPPQVVGEIHGYLIIQISSFELLDGTLPVRSKVKISWWGQKSGPIVLPLPWKPGMPRVEINYPLRASNKVISEYFSDMKSLTLSIINADNILFGHAEVPLNRFTEGSYHDIIRVYVANNNRHRKKVIGSIKVSITL